MRGGKTSTVATRAFGETLMVIRWICDVEKNLVVKILVVDA